MIVKPRGIFHIKIILMIYFSVILQPPWFCSWLFSNKLVHENSVCLWCFCSPSHVQGTVIWPPYIQEYRHKFSCHIILAQRPLRFQQQDVVISIDKFTVIHFCTLYPLSDTRNMIAWNTYVMAMGVCRKQLYLSLLLTPWIMVSLHCCALTWSPCHLSAVLCN
jgi:hypothetical protein